MNDVKLYQFAIFYVPTKEETKEGVNPSMIVDLTTVLARDEKEVLIRASKLISDNYMQKLDRVQIVVRPF